MAETRARFLANTIGATSASNDFTLPNGVGTNKQVLETDGAGGTSWVTSLTAPSISSVTGTLNVYEDGVSEDGGVLTINGTDYGADASVISVQISGTTGFSTVAETTTISLASTSQLTATFTGAETNYNHSSFSAGSTIYVRVTKSGLQSSTYATLGTAMTGDPSFSTTSTTASTHTGTLGATSLGSYGGQIAGGGQDSNTKLLLNFDRTGGTDIEDSSNTSGEGHKITASGNAVIKSSPFGDGKSAMFFDGSNDKLSMSGHADFQFQTANFTVEQWVYFDTVGADQGIWGHAGAGTNADPELSFYFEENTDRITLRKHNDTDSGNSKNFQCSWSPVAKKWYHIALVRNSNQLYIYVDGKALPQVTTSSGVPFENGNVSATNTLPNMSTSRDFLIGCDHSDGRHFQGYMDSFRIVSSAVYSGSFTVPTSRLSAIQSNQGTNIADIASGATKLLIHSDQSDHLFWERTPTITGAIPKSETTNRGSGAHANFGSSAWYFDGSDDKIRISKSEDFNLFGSTSTNRTIDFWVYHTSDPASSGGKMYLCQYDASSPYWEIRTDTANINFSASGSVLGISVAHGMSQNTWYHIAVTKVGTACKIYVDGVLKGSGTQSGTHDLSSNLLTIGSRQQHNDMFWSGYMDEIRISDIDRTASGQDLALSGSSFTPATSAYTSDSNTTLLIHGDGGVFDDSSASDHTITPTGSYHSQAHGGIAPALTFPASLKKTGSAGVYFDGDGDYLQTELSPVMGTGQFTIDFWLYPLNHNLGNAMPFDSRNSSNRNGFSLAIGATGRLSIQAMHDTGQAFFDTTPDTSAGKVAINGWSHVAIERDGSNNFSVYINGIRHILATSNQTNFSEATVNIGAVFDHSSPYFLKGYIDSWRYSNTARYATSDFSSSLPTQIYGAYRSQDVGTIQLVATAGTGGGALDYAELSGGTALSTYGLSLSSSGAITGTLTGIADNSNSGGVVRIRARANTDDNRVTTLGGGSFTGITQNDNKVPTLFNARRYVGTGAIRDINNLGFAPDLVWIKNRNSTASAKHELHDSVNGAHYRLNPDDTTALSSADVTRLSAFTSDGFSLGNSTSQSHNQGDGDTYIAWAWKSGGAPSSSALSLSGGVGAGTIANTGAVTGITSSVNQNSGFSITKYTGTNADAQIPHNLGGTPDWVIIKNLDSAVDWYVWHSGLSSHNVRLNLSSAETSVNSGHIGQGSDAPTSTVVKTKSNGGSSWANVSGSHEYIMYAWKATSVSAFGTYTGNTSSPYVTVTTGFKPSFLMVKCISASGDWEIVDSYRDSASPVTTALFGNLSNAESSLSAFTTTFTSTGFQFTSATTSGNKNVNNATYIYIAFA